MINRVHLHRLFSTNILEKFQEIFNNKQQAISSQDWGNQKLYVDFYCMGVGSPNLHCSRVRCTLGTAYI